MRKLTKVFAGVAVAAIFTIGAALPAQAAGNDFTPSPNKFREYMLNVTSNVLKGAMPGSWKREQLANQYRYNHSWEALNAQFGFDSANPNYQGAPDSYDDYVIKRMEQDKRGGFGGRGFQAPATKPSMWQKTAKVGGAAMALTGFPVGSMLGTAGIDLIGGWFGFDAQGAVCSQSDGWGKTASELLTGRDCTGFAQLSADYVFDEGIKQFCFKGAQHPITSIKNAGCYYISKISVSDSKRDWWDLDVCSFDIADPAITQPHFYQYRNVLEYEVKGVKRTFRTTPNDRGQFYPNLPQPGIAQCKGDPSMRVIVDLDYPKTANGVPVAFQDIVPMDFYMEYQTGYGTPWLKFKGSSSIPGAETDPALADVNNEQLACKVTLDDGTVIEAKGALFSKESGQVSMPSCPGVPKGKTATDVEVTDKHGNTLTDQPTTPEYQDWATEYPECGTGACKLDLIQKPKASCFDLEYQCAEWFEDPDKANKYQCRYGVKNVELEECAVYAGLFKPGRVDTGSPYTDPESGIWSGGKNTPGEDSAAMSRVVQNPETPRGCDGTSGNGGFDPIRFIMRPIQCALEWAFVPRPAVVEAELAGGQHAWDGKPPKVIADAVSGFTVAPSASGCSRSVTLLASTDFATSAQLFNFCPGSPARPLADFSRLATTAAMVVLVVVVVRRQIAAMIGYGAGQ